MADGAHQYQAILKNLHEGYILVDEDANIHDVNDSYCEMIGYSKDELLTMKLTELRPGMSATYQENFIERVKDNGSIEFETQHKTKDGRLLDLNASASAIEKEGKVYLAGLVRNVTNIKKEQRRLEASRRRFKSLFENNPHTVFLFDLDGNFINVNEKATELTGYSYDELLDMNFSSLVKEDDLPAVQRHFEQAVNGKNQKYETTGFTKSGERKDVRVTNFPMVVDDTIVGVFGIVEDITEEKKAQQKLRESEQRWQRLVENNPQCVVICVDEKIRYINKAGAKVLGFHKRGDILGRSQFDFAHPDYWDLIKERDKKLLNDEEIPPSEQKIVSLSGEVKNVLVHSVPIQYKGQDAIQSVLQDITDQKRKEQIIQESLNEKEIMLQEIHHRVKNNMAVISGLLELQAMNIENAELEQVLKESQLRIHSMAMIHEKLYASESLSEIAFNEYIKKLAKTIFASSQKANKQITIRYQLDELTLNINQAIPCGLILNELIVNCFKHAFQGQDAGTILIGLEKNEHSIELWVEDNGVGLPKNFDIDGQDSLGMTLITTLTRQIDGELEVSSGNNGVGTCFKVLLAC